MSVEDLITILKGGIEGKKKKDGKMPWYLYPRRCRKLISALRKKTTKTVKCSKLKKLL